MKRILIYQCALVAALMLAFLACNDNKETITPEPEPETKTETQDTAIAVDKTALNFSSSGVGAEIISVDNTESWAASSDAAWLTAEKQPDNTLKVEVDKSRNPFDRTGTITIVTTTPGQEETSVTITVTQKAGTPTLYVRNLHSIPARHCSENGLWVTGQKSTAVIVVDVTKLVDDAYTGTQTSLSGGAHSIDNNGKPYSFGCSADGTIYSGYEGRSAVDTGKAGSEWFPAHYTPYITRNNRKIYLPYPTDYRTSNIVIPGFVPKHMYQGCIPDKVSADGKYIYGRVMNVNNGWFAARWTRTDVTSNTYTFKELGLNSDGDLNVWDTIYTDAGGTIYPSAEGATFLSIEPVSFLCPQNVSGLSPYGKYACGHYGSGLSSGGQLFRYDMENDQIELLNATGIALYVTDDGTLFDSNNRVHKLGSSTPISLSDWLVEIYGEEIANQVGGLSMGSVSADYSTTVLFDKNGTTSYIITVEP
jgi:hypothetical protein